MVVSCETKLPKHILSEEQMADVLYDYHLAKALASQAKDSVTHREKQYVAAVFKKYGITSAEFDTSLVWYTRHTEQLFDIYKKVSDRYADLSRLLGSNNLSMPQFAVSASGDTVNLWTGSTSCLLRAAPGYNRYSFAYAADSTFSPGDRFLFHMRASFTFPEGRKEAVAVLNVRYENDSIVSRSMTLNNGRATVSIMTDEKLPVKELSGFIYTDASYGAKEKLLRLSDITLLHIRTKKETEKAATDSVAVLRDSIPGDSVAVDTTAHSGMPERRLNRPTPLRKVRK